MSGIFNSIAKNIVSEVEPDLVGYYAKSLYGINIAKQIFNWIDKNIDELQGYSDDGLRNALAKLFFDLFSDKVDVEFEILIAILKLWLEGESYLKMYEAFKAELQYSQIEKICSNSFAYQFCFFI